MWLLEFHPELYDKAMREDGREVGYKEERKRLNELSLLLIQEGKMDDLKHALEDRDFCNQLYQSYNISVFLRGASKKETGGKVNVDG